MIRPKIQVTEAQLCFLRENYDHMANRELAAALGWKLQFTRDTLYTLGLKRMELEYWTVEQTQFLIENYQQIGDKELAELFESKWLKQKSWSFKHIEKKRKYLNLKRTPEQLAAIHQRNVDQGRFLLCPVKRWLKEGVAAEGEIRLWRQNSGRVVQTIKIGNKFVHWNRWAWEKNHGPIPKGMMVVYKDGVDPTTATEQDLELITLAEHGRRTGQKAHGQLSDNYIAGILTINNPELRQEIKKYPALIALKRNQILLNRSINENGKS
jgi:hypothetical protein